MGTRSKLAIKGPPTVRGPVGPEALYDALLTLSEPDRFNNAARRTARALIRKQAKYIRKHVPEDERNAVQRQIIRTHRNLSL